MIPEFPKFKKLELSDKDDVEKFTSKFPPYSDFNFYSMWGWDIHNNIKLSRLNDNLVVLFKDYISDDSFLSFIGSKKVIETTHQLISFSKKNYKKNFLKLVPEEVFLHFKNSEFNVKVDRDASDYVYLVEHLANMKNWTQNTSGKRIRQFTKNNPTHVVKYSSVNEISPQEHKEMFRKWAKSKNINHLELNEYKAFERFSQIKNGNLKFVSLYINETMVGFTMYEILSKNYAISHFAKADKNHHAAIYDLLNWEEAKHLHALGVKYFNWEQDLGMPGLRYSKIKYKPAFILRKLIIKSV